jgi:hypothetical protein
MSLFRTPDDEQTDTISSLSRVKVNVPVSLQRFI